MSAGYPSEETGAYASVLVPTKTLHSRSFRPSRDLRHSPSTLNVSVWLEAWIDLAFFDALHELGQVVLNRGLGHAKGQATIDCAAHRDVVKHASINADDRDSAEVAAALDRLPQNMWAIGAHEGRYLDRNPRLPWSRARFRPHRCRHRRRDLA
jgi:hypothetical protein